ncbi:MAG: transglycosylase domain-containing protein [Acidimicrobiia bacterium]|nr:transglycosylase domain-containing protein [Acidimicrobiia bacterium]
MAATWLGLFSFLGTNSAFGTIEDLEDRYFCNPTDYDFGFPDLSRLSEVYTSDGVLLGKLNLRNSQPVTRDEIPDLVVQALLSAEDGDFYEHGGVDFQAIARAARIQVQGGDIQGGSTITQQVVKNNMLSTEVTLDRKICEAVLAVELERRYTKDQILEFYANSVFYGENAYGVKAAAQEYFGKDLDELTIAEAAAMMTPIRNPTVYDLRDQEESVVRARNAVITQMEANGYITSAEATAARREPLRVADDVDAEELAPEVLIAAREEILNSSEFNLGDTYAERFQRVFGCPAEDTECEGGGGLKITVTVDYALQVEAERILRAWFPADWENVPTGSIAMIDNDTGAIKVMAGGLEFGEDVDSGQRPYDLATKGQRQAGSSFKPFALIAGLEYGGQDNQPITLGSYWDATSPQEIDCGFPCSPQGDIWTVRNAGGGGKGLRTLEVATYTSTNTVYAQVSQAVGPEQIVEVAQRAGVESSLNPVLSIALGTQEVSPIDMAAGYSTIANFGERAEKHIIERIEDNEGNLIYEHTPQRDQVFDEAMMAAVVKTLEKVVSGSGTAPRADIDRPQAGKTGTAQNFRDVWFVGFIPQYTTAVWVGYPDAQVEMVNFVVWDDLNQREFPITRAYGGRLAAPIWKQFMLGVTENLPVEDFPDDPPGTSAYFAVPNTEVPDVLAMEGIEDLRNLEERQKEIESLILHAGLNPVIELVNSIEPEGTFLSQTPAPGTTIRQGREVTIELSSGLPPEAPMPDWIGAGDAEIEGLVTAFAEETNLRITWVRVEAPTSDPLLWGKIVATTPAVDELVLDESVISIIVGVPPPPP